MPIVFRVPSTGGTLLQPLLTWRTDAVVSRSLGDQTRTVSFVHSEKNTYENHKVIVWNGDERIFSDIHMIVL